VELLHPFSIINQGCLSGKIALVSLHYGGLTPTTQFCVGVLGWIGPLSHQHSPYPPRKKFLENKFG